MRLCNAYRVLETQFFLAANFHNISHWILLGNKHNYHLIFIWKQLTWFVTSIRGTVRENQLYPSLSSSLASPWGRSFLFTEAESAETAATKSIQYSARQAQCIYSLRGLPCQGGDNSLGKKTT